MSNNLNLKQFARDSIYNFVRLSMAILLGIIISVLVARGLGVEDRGVYALVFVFSRLLIALLNSGLETTIVYHIARGEKLEEAIPNHVLVSAGISVLGVVVGAAFIFLLGNQVFPGVSRHILLLSLALVPLTIFTQNLALTFPGLNKFDAYNAIAITPKIAQMFLVGLLVWIWPLGITGALGALILSQLVALLMTLRLLSHLAPLTTLLRFAVDRSYLRRIMGYGLRTYAGQISALLNYRVDVFLLSALGSTTSVGLYDVAVGLAERIWILTSSMSQVLLPRIAAATDNQTKAELTTIVARYSLWANVVLGLGVYLLAEWAIVILYGEDYRTAVTALYILLPGIVMMGWAKIFANDLAGRGKPGLTARLTLISVVINIVANFVLIPRFDLQGTALATTISYSSLLVMMSIAFTRLAGVDLRALWQPTHDDWLRLKRVLRLVLKKHQPAQTGNK
jgi:O-antigen/teichoic acid export membrane protein